MEQAFVTNPTVSVALWESSSRHAVPPRPGSTGHRQVAPCAVPSSIRFKWCCASGGGPGPNSSIRILENPLFHAWRPGKRKLPKVRWNGGSQTAESRFENPHHSRGGPDLLERGTLTWSTATDWGRTVTFRKPVDFDQFRETVKSAGLYWLLINQAPVAQATQAAKGAP